MFGLESVYAVLKRSMPKIKEERAVELLSTNPRKLLKLNAGTIKENEKACLTLFCPDAEWIYEKKNILSKSKNSPFIGKKFTGKVMLFQNGRDLIVRTSTIKDQKNKGVIYKPSLLKTV